MKRRLRKEAVAAAVAASILAAGGIGWAVMRMKPQPKQEAAAETAAPGLVGTVLGGWQVNESFGVQVTAEEGERFASASSSAENAEYEAIDVLAKQENGPEKNYACLALEFKTDPAETNYAVVTVSETTQGTASMKGVRILDPSDVHASGSAGSEKEKGWSVLPAFERASLATSPEVARIAREALADFKGEAYQPVALRGTQSGSGTNYRILTRCDQKNGSGTVLYVTTVYIDSKDTIQVTENVPLDLLYYVSE